MPKKRVHELAKELGWDNKELIAHLEKIGIPVKTASSSLEESEVERIKSELMATETREVVEERIKSTVIRRRTIRTPIEIPVEEAPEKEAAKKEDHLEKDLAGKPKKVPSTQPPAKGDKVKKEEPPQPPVSGTEAVSAPSKEKIPEGEAKAETKAHPAADAPILKLKIPKVETTAKTDVQPMADATVVEKIKQTPLVSVVPAKPAIISKHKITRPETSTAIPPKGSLRPGEKIAIPPAEKPKKRGKVPVEVFIEEDKAVPHRKILEKKIEKRLKKQDEEKEIIFTKWRDSKKVAPVKMKKTEITVPKAIKRRIKVGETITSRRFS